MSLIDSLNAMNQNGQVKNVAKCAVWECEDTVVAASHCHNHRCLDDDTGLDQERPILPSAEQPSPPKVVKFKAKRTRGFDFKRPTEVETKPAQQPAKSNETSSVKVSFEERNKKWLLKFRNPAQHSGASRTNEPLSRSQPAPSLKSSISYATPFSNRKSIAPEMPENLQPQPTKSLDKAPLAIEQSPPVSASNNGGGTEQDNHLTAVIGRNRKNLPPSEMADGPSTKSQPGLSSDQNLLPPISTAVKVSATKASTKAANHEMQYGKDDNIVKLPRQKGHALEKSHDTKDGQSNPKKRKLAALEDLRLLSQSSDTPHGAQQGSPLKRALHLDKHRSLEGQAAPPGAFAIRTDSLQGLDESESSMLRSLEQPSKVLVASHVNETKMRHASEPLMPLIQTKMTLVRRATMSPTWKAPKSKTETNSRAIVESSPNGLHREFENVSRGKSPLAFMRFQADSSQPPLSDLMKVDEDSSTSIETGPAVQKAKLPLHIPSEERRKSKVMEFQSEAFDRMIYLQSSMPPPHSMEGIQASTENFKPIPHDDNERLYLPVNPAIHRLHNRSQEWHREKTLEIEARRGRKFWFGKVAARQRWLRAKEKEKEKKILDALAQGRRLPPSEPQPWTYNRILDFGDIPEDELPEDVLGHSSWLKACGWHREINSQRRKEFDERRIRRQRAIISAAQRVQEQYMLAIEDTQKGKKSLAKRL